MRRLNLLGKRFGRLLVIADAGNDEQQRSTWKCLCDCGNDKIIKAGSLRSGLTRSCGCLLDESLNKRHEGGYLYSIETKRKMSKIKHGKKGKDASNYKHGLSKTKGYSNAISMKRHVKKKNQTPLDADLEKIQKIYSFCEKLNKIESFKYEVDHIIPISKGGLHHQDNLQILSASLNRKKHNKITDEYIGINLNQIEEAKAKCLGMN